MRLRRLSTKAKVCSYMRTGCARSLIRAGSPSKGSMNFLRAWVGYTGSFSAEPFLTPKNMLPNSYPCFKRFVLHVSRLRQAIWRLSSGGMQLNERTGSLALVPCFQRLMIVCAFHKSVFDWLTDENGPPQYYIDIQEGHRCLADFGWKQYQQGVDKMGRYSVI